MMYVSANEKAVSLHLQRYTVGLCNGHYVYLPIPPLISRAREVDPVGLCTLNQVDP
jgi:hypothetical protein